MWNEEASRALYEDCRGATRNAQETVELVRKAVAENRRAYVLVNNRSEGIAPLAVQGLVGMFSK